MFFHCSYCSSQVASLILFVFLCGEIAVVMAELNHRTMWLRYVFLIIQLTSVVAIRYLEYFLLSLLRPSSNDIL